MAGRRRSLDAARVRVGYLGEAAPSARYVVGRNQTPVIDECSAAQQSVRALLALLVFNYVLGENYQFNRTPFAEFTLYGFVLSPRWDSLVIVSMAPDNIALRLLDAGAGFRFAGETVTADEEYVYRLDHPALGTTVTVTSDKGTLAGVRTAVREDLRPFSPHVLGVPLTSEEREAIEFVNGLDRDVRALLAGLFIRLRASDGRRWAVGSFYGDPLKRPPAPWWDQHPERSVRRSLRGEGRRWELRWNTAPFPGDIVAALTHSACGLPGAQADDDADARRRTISFGAARLALRPY